MQYVYAALLLNDAGQKITEEAVKKVVNATGAKAEDAKAKALVAALDGVDINEAISKAVVAPLTSTATPVEGTKEVSKDEKAEEKKEDVGKSAEEAAAGLGALFG